METTREKGKKSPAPPAVKDSAPPPAAAASNGISKGDICPDDGPEDYQDLGQSEFHPWVDKKAMVGKAFMGKLRGRFQKTGARSKGGYGFTIELEKVPEGGVPCITSDPETRERVDVNCKPGDTISLDHTAALDELQNLLDGGGLYSVWLKIKEVSTLQSGNTFYRWQTKSKCLVPPPKPAEGSGENPF